MIKLLINNFLLTNKLYLCLLIYLIEILYPEMFLNDDRIQLQDQINYLIVLQFGMSICRHKYYIDKAG